MTPDKYSYFQFFLKKYIPSTKLAKNFKKEYRNNLFLINFAKTKHFFLHTYTVYPIVSKSKVYKYSFKIRNTCLFTFLKQIHRNVQYLTPSSPNDTLPDERCRFEIPGSLFLDPKRQNVSMQDQCFLAEYPGWPL